MKNLMKSLLYQIILANDVDVLVLCEWAKLVDTAASLMKLFIQGTKFSKLIYIGEANVIVYHDRPYLNENHINHPILHGL